jgi:hypothetical protein
MIVLAVVVSPRIKPSFYLTCTVYQDDLFLFTIYDNDLPLKRAAEKVCVIKWDSNVS